MVMKNMIISLLLLLSIGCTTTKPTQSLTPNSSCHEMEKELNRLKKNKNIDIANTTAMLLLGVYGQSKDEQRDEKIRVLELKLSGCQ